MTRKVVIPGEVIVSGENYLPGDGTEKQGDNIIALKYGLGEEMNNLVKVIPLSGVYSPRRGNSVIGKVESIFSSGWFIDIGAPDNAFLSLMEVPRYVNKDAMKDVFDVGDTVAAKIWNISGRGIDLTVKSRELGKLSEGLIFEVNSNKVPRIIGKEGSMVNIIKDETGCNIMVGQNGVVWVKGDSIEKELFAKEAVLFVAENSFIEGLTEEIKKWFEEKKGGRK
jgi:exosome complex component RRP4